MNPESNDSLDDLLGARTESPKAAVILPANYKPADFSEPCRKCGGSGTYRRGHFVGRCFACKGLGKVTFKTSPETRAQNRASTTARKQRSAAEAVEAFKTEHADVWAWMDGNDFGYAVKLLADLHKYGSLTDGKLAAARGCIAKLAAAKAASAERAAAAPIADTAGIDRLKLAFDTAIANAAAKGKGVTLRRPRITIGGMVISPAKATSANPGALYVKSGETYLGKITQGRFFASRECSPEAQSKVLAFVADPAAAAKAYGQETGVCCICNATLVSKWRLLGIGPVCAQKFGW